MSRPTKIVLASVLDPVDDNRMSKLAGTIAKIDNTEVHIIGQNSPDAKILENVIYHPVFDFKRLSPKRLFTGIKMWRTYIKVKPEVIICNTHELLIVTCLYKILFGISVFYDIRENYYRNLRHGAIYSAFSRYFVAPLIRLKERLLVSQFDTRIVAEKTYLDQMPSITRDAIILENRVSRKAVERYENRQVSAKNPLHLVYSGTIGEDFGIFRCLALARRLLGPEDHFTIAGYCPDRKTLSSLKSEIEGDPRIELIGGDKPVPHHQILGIISNSNLALTGYTRSPAIETKLPTRFFEYIALKVPFIIPDQPDWVAFAQSYDSCIVVDFDDYDAGQVKAEFYARSFYNSGNDAIFWDDQEDAILDKIQSVLNK